MSSAPLQYVSGEKTMKFYQFSIKPKHLRKLRAILSNNHLLKS